MTQLEIMKVFAKTYWAAIEPYRLAIGIKKPDSVSYNRFRSEFKKGLKWPLKHCGTLVPPGASKTAYAIAKEKGVDLHALQWKDQPVAEKVICGISGRNLIIHEHKIPVDTLYKRILAAKSEQEVLSTLLSQEIVWVTREENSRLPQYERVGNEYEEQGIQVIKNPYGDDWMERKWKI